MKQRFIDFLFGVVVAVVCYQAAVTYQLREVVADHDRVIREIAAVINKSSAKRPSATNPPTAKEKGKL